MALAAKIATDFQKRYAPPTNEGKLEAKLDVVSDDEQDSVIVATKVIEDKAKEVGKNTVEPLLSSDGLEESKAPAVKKEEEKDRTEEETKDVTGEYKFGT